MQENDKQFGVPFNEYTNIKAVIEALPNVGVGSVAFATDTNQYGYYRSGGWQWINPTGTNSAGHIIQKDGVDLTTRLKLNFVGGDFAVYDGTGSATTVSGTVYSNLTFYVNSNGGSDGNSGLTSGTAFATITKALNQLRGHVLANCTIRIYPGTYAKFTLDKMVGGVSDLTLWGDGQLGNKSLLGQGFVHASNLQTFLFANQDIDGRIRFYVTGTSSTPDFAADGIDTTNKLLVFNGTTTTEYSIHTVGDRYIKVTTSGSAPTMTVSGSCVTVLPNVKIQELSSGDTVTIDGVSAKLKGLYIYCESGGGLSMTNGARLVVDKIGMYAKFNSNPLSLAIHCSVSNEGSNPITILPGGVILDAISYAKLDGGTFGPIIADMKSNMSLVAAQIVKCSIGVTATKGAYIDATNTGVRNFGAAKFSPATADTFGVTGGMISF